MVISPRSSKWGRLCTAFRTDGSSLAVRPYLFVSLAMFTCRRMGMFLFAFSDSLFIFLAKRRLSTD